MHAPLRYDQYDQAWIRAESLLLGASKRPSAGCPCCVCTRSLHPACCCCALLMTRQLRTTFWYYPAIRWSWGWQTSGDGGEAPPVPGSFNDCTSLSVHYPQRTQLSETLRQYSDRFDCVISADEGGFVEYWRPGEQFELPTNVPGLWSFKTQTDLYEFKKVMPCGPPPVVIYP
jgi:hypothetical protein